MEICIIGAGKMGLGIIENLHGTENYQIRVHDLDNSVQDSLNEMNIDFFDNLEEMLLSSYEKKII